MTNNTLKEKYNKLLQTEMYKEFIEHHADYKLSHFFFVYEKNNFLEQHIGFYSKNDDKVVSFDLLKHIVSKPEDAMKRNGIIPFFDVNDVKTGIDEALKISKDIQEKNYPPHTPNKYICILQVLENILNWNITIVTSTMHIINIKIDASNSKVLKNSAKPIMSLAKG